MKTLTVKPLTALTALILIIFLTSAFNKQQSGGAKYATVRTIDTGPSCKIMIVYENGQTEEINLEGSHKANLIPNAIKLNQTLNNLTDKGYELISSTGGDYYTTYVFLKK